MTQTLRPLPCTRCGSPCRVVWDYTSVADWGTAVIDSMGTIRPAVQQVEFFKGDPYRSRAICEDPACRHQWTLRRPFEPEAPAP
ncbi:hypothetical protein [Streptomyces sp. NPDC048669]|uniref:hypothetical protein n=1 Tax=Streptomyces sp. NPDC048669 TaxID=3155267 RepID=UPI003418AABF